MLQFLLGFYQISMLKIKVLPFQSWYVYKSTVIAKGLYGLLFRNNFNDTGEHVSTHISTFPGLDNVL